MNKEKFENFSEVKNPRLKSYNRVVMLFNIKEDFGEVYAREYISQFSNLERAQMMLMLMAIEKDGIESIRKSLNVEPELTEEEVQYA